MNWPALAGLDVTPLMLPVGATNVVVLAICTTPWFGAPVAPVTVKTPGAPDVIVTLTGVLPPPAVVTTSEAVVADSSSQGTWKLICPLETKNKPHSVPFIVTVVPLRFVGRGKEPAE